MAVIKKNIWTLFYIILFLSSVVLGIIVFRTYKSTINEYTLEQENLTKITANSIESVFLQYEMMLDILGHQLIENKNYENLEKSRKILDSLLELNPSIAAFGLAKPNGQLYVTSSNLKNIKRLPNLMKKNETKESFSYVLEKDVMVIGRTYYHNTLKSLIIPIRKSIRDSEDNVVSVMTAGINVNKSFKLLSDSVHRTVIFRDFDYFYQLTDNRMNNQVYKKSAPSNYIEYIFETMSEKYKFPIDIIKANEILTTAEWDSILSDSGSVLSSSKFLNRYELWVVTQINSNVVNSVFYEKALSLFISFIIIFIVLYILFRYIDEYEKRKQKELHFQATHDYLTKLNNRLFLSKEFEKRKKKKPFSLFFIDLDNFKNVNDNYGHTYGDLILIEVANRLLSFKDENDFLVRYSGDEFLLITYKTEKSKIKELALSIVQRLSEPYFINQYQFILGASIGVSQYPLDANTFDEIKRYADIAMYEAKKEKNSYRIFEDAIKHKYLKASKIEQELKTAVQNNEIYMVYQPQIKNDGSLYGVEALVRWENDSLGFVPPDEFIKIAEDTGLMSNLGKHIMRTSIEEIKDIQNLTNITFQLSINISVKQFMEIEFYEKLFEYIEKFSFNKLHITLEVTENVFIEDLKYILKLMNKLKDSEVKISLDDFGTGYSSLSLLRKLPIDELKIDKTFVDDITHDEDSLAMARSIISIGKKFNMIILAEGIETLEQKKLLEKYDCDLYQGYYYSKPLKKDELLDYIKK